MSNLNSTDKSSFFKRICALICVFSIAAASVFADAGDDYEAETEENGNFAVSSNMNEAGDQFIKIGLMVTIPLNFNGTMLVGGAGELGYHRFFTNSLMWGIDVSFGYNPTIGKNVFTYIPLVASLTYQPVLKKFEFPLTAGVGFAVENYLNKSYFPGLVLKGDAGAFFRMSPSWSFGLEGQFMYMPQWYKDSKHNSSGTFASIELVARYHF